MKTIFVNEKDLLKIDLTSPVLQGCRIVVHNGKQVLDTLRIKQH